jgi:hypothetical protein
MLLHRSYHGDPIALAMQRSQKLQDAPVNRSKSAQMTYATWRSRCASAPDFRDDGVFVLLAM